MQFIQRTVPKNFNLFILGDLHIGSLLHHEHGFDSFIEQVKKPYGGVKHSVVVGMGDYIEAIDTSDKRFDFDTTDLRKIKPELQMDHFVEKMMEIRHRIATLLYGNHEQKLMRYCDYVKGACNQLEVPYGTYSAVVSFVHKNGSPMFKGFFTHGYGQIGSTADSPERQVANMKIQLKRKLWRKSGDCALMAMGHTHKLIIAEPETTLYLTSDGERVKQQYTSVPQGAEFVPKDLRWYVNTGSLLRLYRKGVSGYAERACYDPMELGYPIVRVRNSQIVGVDKIIV